MIFRQRVLQRSLVIILALFLSGCITANTSLVINPDGSGELTNSIGFPYQLIALMSSKNIDPVSDLRKSLVKQLEYKVDSDRWNDRGFEWLQLIRPFDNPDELNSLAIKQPFVDSFRLWHERHFLKDWFTINAQFTFDQSSNPFLDIMSKDQVFSNFDAEAPIDLKISLRLPGKILETNGEYDSFTKTVLWESNDLNTIEIFARSESWNMINIAFAVALALLAIVLVALIIKILLRVRKRNKPLEEEVVSQRIADSIQAEEEEEISTSPKAQTAVIPPSKILAMIGARELLEQVNTHVLNNRGNISTGKGAIRLVWRDQQDEAVTRGLMITVRDSETILINGVPFPATRDAARQGLISCLKGMTQQ